MILRPANPDDAAALAAIGRDSFVAAFGHLYSEEDLSAFLGEYKTERHYRDYLRDPGTRVWLAEDAGTFAGFGLIVLGKGFDERPRPHPARPACLSQLYCAPQAVGRGIGASIMERLLAEARGWRADAIQLSVYSGNVAAQRFYRRYGFEKVADIHFWVGNQRDDEFLFELKL
jgi:ribosomal protein S18 acetylase RimI-like enzyme